MYNMLVSKKKQPLAVYQKSNAICPYSSSSSQSDDPEYTKIPKMLSNADTKQKHIAIVDEYIV